MHLRRFADDRDQVMEVVLHGEVRRRVSTRKAARQRSFYTAELEDGTQTDALEDSFGSIEGAAANAIREVVDGGLWPIEGETRAAIAMWVALQYLRTPAVRRQGEEMADTLLKLQIAAGGKRQLRRVLEQQQSGPVSDEVLEDEWRLTSDFDSYRVRTHPNQHLRTIVDAMPGLTRVTFARGWQLMRFRRRFLITSDNPVVVAVHPDDPMGNAGLVSAGSVYVPLDRRVGLVMGELEADDKQRDGTTSWWRTLNYEMAFNARQCVFHHPDDDIAGTPLPEPRDQEMEDVDVSRFIPIEDRDPAPE